MSQPRASSEDSYRRYPVPAWHFDRPVCRQSWLWIACSWQQAAFTNGSEKAERERGGWKVGRGTDAERGASSAHGDRYLAIESYDAKTGLCLVFFFFSCLYMRSFSSLIHLFVYADPLFHYSSHHQCSKENVFWSATLLFFLPFFCLNCESGCSLEYMLTGACSPRNPLPSYPLLFSPRLSSPLLSCPLLSSPPNFSKRYQADVAAERRRLLKEKQNINHDARLWPYPVFIVMTVYCGCMDPNPLSAPLPCTYRNAVWTLKCIFMGLNLENVLRVGVIYIF